MAHAVDRIVVALRLAAGLGIAAAGLVAVLPHPTAGLWMASIVLSEGGYWLALLASPLVVDLRAWRRSEDGRPTLRILAATAALAGIVLLLSPVAGAYAVARTLPDLLETRFGTPVRSPLAGPPRPAPVSLPALLAGVGAGEVVVEEHVYAVREEDDLRLDLYRPVLAEGALPVVVMIHGGGWSTGDKRDFSALNDYLAARGYVVAAIRYRLLPDARFPAAQDDVAEAIRYLGSLAETHHLDPDRIALVGRSAGGQIALLAGYAAGNPAIRGVVSFYAPTALRWGYANPAKPGVIDSSAVLDAYLGGPPATHGAQYDAAEPARFVSASTPPHALHPGVARRARLAVPRRVRQRAPPRGRCPARARPPAVGDARLRLPVPGPLRADKHVRRRVVPRRRPAARTVGRSKWAARLGAAAESGYDVVHGGGDAGGDAFAYGGAGDSRRQAPRTGSTRRPGGRRRAAPSTDTGRVPLCALVA